MSAQVRVREWRGGLRGRKGRGGGDERERPCRIAVRHRYSSHRCSCVHTRAQYAEYRRRARAVLGACVSVYVGRGGGVTAEGVHVPLVVVLLPAQLRARRLHLARPRLRLALLLAELLLQAAQLGRLLRHGLLHGEDGGLQAARFEQALLLRGAGALVSGLRLCKFGLQCLPFVL